MYYIRKQLNKFLLGITNSYGINIWKLYIVLIMEGRIFLIITNNKIKMSFKIIEIKITYNNRSITISSNQIEQKDH